MRIAGMGDFWFDKYNSLCYIVPIMDYLKYRDRRLREDPELARAYEQENLEREISREILRLRQARGWSQARLESGSHRPSLATLDRICQVLDARLEVRLTPCEADSG